MVGGAQGREGGMGALEWEWGMLGSQMCAHARGCASAQSLHTCVCLCVPALCMGTQSRRCAGVHAQATLHVCTCSMHVCVYLPRAHLCTQVCPIHAHFCVSAYLVL